MSVDRAAFDAVVARHFRPATAAQRERWWEAWAALEQAPAQQRGFAQLLEPDHTGPLHGLAWWEAGRERPAETDVLCAFLCASTQVDATPLPWCPPSLAGHWLSPDGARLTLGLDGVYGLSRPAETGSWRMHRSLMDELWIQRTGSRRRALEALSDGDHLVLRSLAGAPEQRWRRA